jgi:hypothetical protein
MAGMEFQPSRAMAQHIFSTQCQGIGFSEHMVESKNFTTQGTWETWLQLLFCLKPFLASITQGILPVHFGEIVRSSLRQDAGTLWTCKNLCYSDGGKQRQWQQYPVQLICGFCSTTGSSAIRPDLRESAGTFIIY